MKGIIKAKEEELFERELHLTIELQKLHLEKEDLEMEKKFLHQFEEETTRFDEVNKSIDDDDDDGISLLSTNIHSISLLLLSSSL